MRVLLCNCQQCRGNRVYRRIVTRQKRSGQRGRNRQALKSGRWEQVKDVAYVGYTD